jgi:chromosome segregation ATPase
MVVFPCQKLNGEIADLTAVNSQLKEIEDRLEAEVLRTREEYKQLCDQNEGRMLEAANQLSRLQQQYQLLHKEMEFNQQNVEEWKQLLAQLQAKEAELIARVADLKRKDQDMDVSQSVSAPFPFVFTLLLAYPAFFRKSYKR